MADVILPSVVPIKRVYPHTDEITDAAAAQSVRLAWDRIHSLEERLQAQEAGAQVLAAAHNTNAAAIAVAQTTAREAITIAQTPTPDPSTPSGGLGTAGPAPGPPPGAEGSQSNPIIAMSSDPAAIAASVRASRQFYGFGAATDDQYWIDKASTVAQFSNGKWYLGWNRYWEVRADPANTGSADPALGSLPAIHT